MPKAPVDNSKSYRFTEHPFRDKVFNAIVARYGKKGNLWEKSDDFVWGNGIYVVWDYFWWLFLIGAIWWVLSLIQKHQGWEHAALLVGVLIFVQLMRVNRALRKIDKNFKM